MLREYQTTLDKNINAMATAEVAMVTGMGVVYDPVNQIAGLPTEATYENIYFVNKERVPTGLYAAVSDWSDYADIFVNIEAGEKVKLIPTRSGERYGTDQYDESLAEGDLLAVGTDGKWTKASGESKYLYAGIASDANAHDLLIIQVLDNATSSVYSASSAEEESTEEESE